MTALVQIDQGTAPAGSDGDTVRAAFTKVNSNVTVLSTQAALTSGPAVNWSQGLSGDHIGKRIAVNIPNGAPIALPPANFAMADSVILLCNTGSAAVPLISYGGYSNILGLAKINPGESVLMSTDGDNTWSCLMRGRTNSDNETVIGNLSVGGSITATGTTVPNSFSAPIAVTSSSNTAGIVLKGASAGWSSGFQLWNTGSTNFGIYSGSDGVLHFTNETAGTGLMGITAAGAAYFTLRPTWGGFTPWDSNNLASPWSAANLSDPARLSGVQTFTGAKTFGSSATISSPGGSTYTSATLNLVATAANNVANIGFNSAGIGGVLRLGITGNYDFLNFAANAYSPIVCSSVSQTSDRAFKSNITDLSRVLPKLRGKRAVSYALKSDPSTQHIGVVAQEWQTDFPELVVDTGVDIDEDGDFIAHQYDKDGNEIFGPNGKPESRKALGFNYANASAVALQAVIDLDAALTAALARIAALEAKP